VQALEIDTKIDDGAPYSGRLHADDDGDISTQPAAEELRCVNDLNLYDVSSDNLDETICILAYRLTS